MDRPLKELPSAGGARSGIIAMLAFAILLALPPAAGARQRFGPAGAIPVPTERLFDLGVVDYDGDGFLDVFTTNHKFHSGLLRNGGDGNFTDITGASGLSPTPAFPGYEDLRPPVTDKTGVYVFATDSKREKLPGRIHIAAVGTAVQGSMSFGSDAIALIEADGATTESGKTDSGQPIVYFSIKPDGHLILQPQNLDLPIVVSIQPPPSEEPSTPDPILPLFPTAPSPPPPSPGPAVYVGADAVAAPADFALNLKDRHGFTFADLGGDGTTDLFAVSGGLGGRIKLGDYTTKVQDELLISGGGRYSNQSAGSGLVKGGCRARQSAAVDFDADGLLDLFESCEGDPPEIFRQGPMGSFTNFSTPPKAIAGRYRWVDLGGNRPVLLAAEKRATVLRTYTDGGWRIKQQIRDNARNGQIAQYAVNDYDNDGMLDVLAVSRTGNTLLHNIGRGKLREVPLKGTGIPSHSVAASFVDYDNDGRIDLDLVPQGLYRGVGEARFKRTGRLRRPPAGAGVTAWTDYDNDGLRDPLIATGNAEFAKRMKVVRAHNLGPGGHWLEVNLFGKDGNRQAIGARVEIKSGGDRLYGWPGQSEDSHHSQGHYRMYFGLGRHAKVEKMIVRWPDGSRSKFGTLRADRVLNVEQP